MSRSVPYHLLQMVAYFPFQQSLPPPKPLPTRIFPNPSKSTSLYLTLNHQFRPFPKKSSRIHSSTTVSASAETRLFVGNLEYGVDGAKLAQLFQQAGDVETAEVMYYRETEPRGFGFIKMSTVEEADKAMEMFDCFDLNGRPLIVCKATHRRTLLHPLGRKIFVANLPFDVDDECLEQLFSEHAMSTEAEMNDAIANLNGKTIGGRLIRVNFVQEKPRRFFT